MGMLVEHTPPEKKIYKLDYTRHRVYLAGSINGDDWQSRFVEKLTDLNVDVFNPRAKGTNFEWELDHLNIATIIPLYFDPKDLSPSGLLTLGMFAKTNRLMVCCPSAYHSSNEVVAVCKRENVHIVDTLELLIDSTIARLPSKRKYVDHFL